MHLFYLAEIELNTLERRFSTKSLPPLKLRPNMSPTETLSEDLEKNLFLTAFEDPSLKHSSADPDQLRFMSRLGLKQASKTEKYRRFYFKFGFAFHKITTNTNFIRLVTILNQMPLNPEVEKIA